MRHIGTANFDLVMIRASKKVIIVTEEVISLRTTELDPERTSIPCFMVDAVVELPFGAHPCSCSGIYQHDEEHLKEYLRCAELVRTGKDPGAFKEYIKKYIDQPEEQLLNAIEFGIRCYDPCLSCATHRIGEMKLAVTIRRNETIIRQVRR